VFKIIRTASEIDSRVNAEKPLKKIREGKIEITSVDFKYPSRE
jgi:hypothetical protein